MNRSEPAGMPGCIGAMLVLSLVVVASEAIRRARGRLVEWRGC